MTQKRHTGHTHAFGVRAPWSWHATLRPHDRRSVPTHAVMVDRSGAVARVMCRQQLDGLRDDPIFGAAPTCPKCVKATMRAKRVHRMIVHGTR